MRDANQLCSDLLRSFGAPFKATHRAVACYALGMQAEMESAIIECLSFYRYKSDEMAQRRAKMFRKQIGQRAGILPNPLGLSPRKWHPRLLRTVEDGRPSAPFFGLVPSQASAKLAA